MDFAVRISLSPSIPLPLTQKKKRKKTIKIYISLKPKIYISKSDLSTVSVETTSFISLKWPIPAA